jgi:hypothetical protein
MNHLGSDTNIRAEAQSHACRPRAARREPSNRCSESGYDHLQYSEWTCINRVNLLEPTAVTGQLQLQPQLISLTPLSPNIAKRKTTITMRLHRDIMVRLIAMAHSELIPRVDGISGRSARMHSEIDSELTRNSLLSERTASPTPEKQASYFDVARGSPRQTMSPASRTPTRTSF